MTLDNAVEKASKKFQNATLETLKETAVKLNDDLTAPDEAFMIILGVLEQRMPEMDFVEFCESL